MNENAKNKPAFRMGYYRKVHPQDKGRWAELGAVWTSKDGRGLNACFSAKPLDGQWDGWIYLRPVEESSQEVEETLPPPIGKGTFSLQEAQSHAGYRQT